MLTLANLICGALAITTILRDGDYTLTFMLIILAAVFDVFEGFVARLLNQSSPIGVELDSLADIVSFGVAPSLVMMQLFNDSAKIIDLPQWSAMGCYLPLIIAAFSALRLAKFNIDDSQTYNFVGLPTPASALLCASLGLLYTEGWALYAESIVAISIVMAYLLISPIRMFALKFSGYGWSRNEVRYIFLTISAALFAIFKLDAIALIILLYIIISCVTYWLSLGRR